MERKTASGLRRLLAKAAAASFMLPSLASAETKYLGPLISFVSTLQGSFRIMGSSIAIIMFVYGAVKYVYTADDPGGRKQAIGICVAAIIALIIIQAAEGIISSITVAGT